MDFEYPKENNLSLDPLSKRALFDMQLSLREIMKILSRIEEKLENLGSQ
jgi:hypothetical protein